MRSEHSAAHWQEEPPPTSALPSALHKQPFEWWSAHRGRIMAEHESLEFGKADFVLLDNVSMEEFMSNLKLR